MTFLQKVTDIKKDKYKAICFFKCGIFYIAIDDDAILLNRLFSFKINKFGSSIKVGVPIYSLFKYLIELSNLNIKYIVYDNFLVITQFK